MKKYIRTKDRIWLSENIGYDESGHAYSKITDFYLDFTRRDIIKKADTIVELVDEFVLGKTEFLKPYVTKLPLDFLKECVIKKDPYDLVVYACIWVFDYHGVPTLKPVAKMNDKGELELL